MREFFIYPYNAASESAILLSEKLDCYRINRTNSSFTRGDHKVIINWGNGSPLPREVQACPHIINKWQACSLAINKIDTFDKLKAARVRTVEFTRSKTEAQAWLNSGKYVFARTRVEGSDGAGLVLVKPETGAVLPSAPLYTKGIVIPNIVTNIREYRVNVFNGEAFSYQIRTKVTDRTDHDPIIRTTSGGWAFDVVEEHSVRRNIDAEAVAAVEALGLDFGGVDIITDNSGVPHVLEVNTAPHLTLYSAGKFAAALKEYLEELG